jgi:RNA polymerase sigma factor (sigma-70 family)
MDDPALLQSYAEEGSEEAFGQLVARHVATVYSAARRQVGEPLAADVTQAVFLLLSRKAAKLRGHKVLAAWLLTTTRLVCRATLRKEIRRQQREQEAAAMPNPDDESEIQSAWEQVQPMLDEALAALSKSDRNLVVLRFFEQKSHAEIAAVLRLNEDASKKRLSRALERLRAFFSRRGITVAAAVLLAAIAQNAVQAAPSALAAAISATIAGGTAGATVTALVNTTQKLMTLAKLKIAALSGAALLLVTVAPLVAVQNSSNVVADPEKRDARLERYVFQAAPVWYKTTPNAPKPNEVLSPGFAGERLLSAEFSWEIGPNFRSVESLRIVTGDGNGNIFDPIGNTLTGRAIEADRQYWVDGADVFPRRGKEVRLRLVQDQETIAEFKIPNPAPGPYPTWTPSPLPVASTQDGLEVTLAKFAAYQTSPEISAQHARSPRTECVFTFRENNRETIDWRPVVFEVSDATGNHWLGWPDTPFSGTIGGGNLRSGFRGALWPGESAWKLRVEFNRTGSFPENELLHISNIRIPNANELWQPHTHYEQNGVNVELAAVAGADVPGDQSGPLVNVPRTKGLITVVLKGSIISMKRRMTFVSATDEQGHDCALAEQHGPCTIQDERAPVPFSFVFRPLQTAKELNLVVAISQGRTVEFVAKPEQVIEAVEGAR